MKRQIEQYRSRKNRKRALHSRQLATDGYIEMPRMSFAQSMGSFMQAAMHYRRDAK